ncbi:unnamed protein product [Mytilus coruscus]|uniref:Uncharacterized protein n=1 Tax=Mytilus coruscus TaxID=42192 RepID=A0A6J8BGU1_MYTCO|nr:unnamed protein product [Mytilus coruscus]
MKTFMKVFKDLGVPLAENKTVGPMTALVFLGHDIDTLLILGKIPENKVIRSRTLAPEADQTPSDIPVEFHMVNSNLKCRINSSIGVHMTKHGGCYIRYPDIKTTDEFLAEDGMHLTKIGNEIFLNIIQAALETIISSKTGGITFPDDYSTL